MQLHSTNNPNLRVSLREAVMAGMPEDRGLFMPVDIPRLPERFFQNLASRSFQEISIEVAQYLLQGAIPARDLDAIVEGAIDFPAPLFRLDDSTYILELFHGPSLAFKDFGARFMAKMMAYFNRDENKELLILVATSGDTGGAVAAGFFKAPGIKVVILYPSGKVSPLQEKQLTTLGHNITAIEVDGTFDDCQSLVKQTFLDREVTSRIRLSSANSINIARLIPQSFYYFEGYKQAMPSRSPIVFSVPSGNFGNLTAGLLAKKMGLPIARFIAATNANDVVPAYLETGAYAPRASTRTLSNAMDVGTPSNFARMLDLYCSTWNMIREDVIGFSFSDEETEEAMRDIDKTYNYVIDPHGAVGYLALRKYQRTNPCTGIVLETAHPGKFVEDVTRILGHPIEIPSSLAELGDKEKRAVSIKANYPLFKSWLLQNV
ncbi:MAG: threonine synthase [Saprospiraceae bacterium]|nr:threonine synthase [Saprospiraceae bacterium]